MDSEGPHRKSQGRESKRKIARALYGIERQKYVGKEDTREQHAGYDDRHRPRVKKYDRKHGMHKHYRSGEEKACGRQILYALGEGKSAAEYRVVAEYCVEAS